MDDTARLQPMSDRALTLTYFLHAPRLLVFGAWTEQEHLGRWWAPDGFTMTTHEMDVRPGGCWRFSMQGPDGTAYRHKIVYVELAPPVRLAYIHAVEEEYDPLRFLVTVALEEEAGKTRLTLQLVFDSTEARDRIVGKLGGVESTTQTLRRLERHLADLPAQA